MLNLVFASALALMAQATVPAENAVAQPAATDAAKPATSTTAEKMVCKREPQIGSKFTKKVCMSKAERDERARQSREVTENLQRNGTTYHGGN